ncbi:MAG: AMP-binding protein [Pseudomonadota bacterium]
MPPSPNLQTLGDVATRNAAQYGGKTAFQDDFRAVSFAQFAQRAQALRQGLLHIGIKPGERVAFLSKNRIECLELFLACEAGIIIVPINWRLTPADIAHVLADCAPSAIVVEPEFALDIEPILATQPSIRHRFCIGSKTSRGWTNYESLISCTGDPILNDQAPSANHAACIVYTSGTTGQPKGAVLSHSALLASCGRIGDEMLQLSADDVTLVVMPLFHVGGMWFHCFPSFAAGAFTRIQRAFRPDDALDAICVHKVSNVHLAPTMLADMLHRPATPQAARHLKTIFYAASPMPMATLAKAKTQFANSGFVQSYGSTEAGTVCWLSQADHSRDSSDKAAILGSCGRPFAGVQIDVRDGAGAAVPIGAVGEIYVKSTSTMQRYWNNQVATARTKINGWVATGDLGRQDQAGYLTIIDRKNDMIISGGENIYPAEVEEVLNSMPGVAQAAVFGAPDDRWVERVVSCIVPEAGASLTEQGTINYVKRRLARYKCPKEVHVLTELPRNAAGKVLKRQLAQRYPFDSCDVLQRSEPSPAAEPC